MKKKLKIPQVVLERARAAAEGTPGKKPSAPPPPKHQRQLARAKVVAALKKLHPMD